MSYLDTFAKLQLVLHQCNEAQELIDEARRTFPSDGYMQLQLDRKQEELNEKRELAETVVANLASLN